MNLLFFLFLSFFLIFAFLPVFGESPTKRETKHKKLTAVPAHQLHNTNAILGALSLNMGSVDCTLSLLHSRVESKGPIDDLKSPVRNDSVFVFVFFFY